jgi:uncharacterized membrane protein
VSVPTAIACSRLAAVTAWFGPEAPAIKRLVAATVVGLLALGVAMAFSPWQLDLLAVWDGTAAAYLIGVWLEIGRLDNAQTAATATREDDTRAMTRVLLLVTSTVSLVGVGLALAKATREGGSTQAVISVFAVVTIVLSWAVVHTTYLLRYAHLYYLVPPGGIDFNGDDEPDYLDFAYLAFTLGMTYQVSDTDIQDPTIRRTVLAHTLLSYVFGTVIIAATINIVAGFVH